MNELYEVRGNLTLIIPIDIECIASNENDYAVVEILKNHFQSKIGTFELLHHDLKFTRVE